MPNPYTRRKAPLRNDSPRALLFDECVVTAIERVVASCPEAMAGIDIGIDEVPSSGAVWEEMALHDQIPLAAAIDPKNNQPGKVVLFRRPLEHRAVSRYALAELVHHTLVEQLSVLTGRTVTDIDPDFDQW